MSSPSLTVAGVTAAVGSALASILSSKPHLRSLKVHFAGNSDAQNESLPGIVLGDIWKHLTAAATTAAFATCAAATVSSAAGHFQQ